VRRRWWIGVPLVITAAVLIALAISARNPSDTPTPRDSVRLAVPLQPTSLLTLVALDQGYFAARGLDVQVQTYPSGKLALEQGLFAGEADIAWANEVPIALAGFTRSDFRIVAADLWSDNVNKIVARRDRGIATPADLRGKHIATQEGSTVHFFLHLFLMRHNLTDRDVSLSFLKAVELPDALAEGRIDAFSMREPFVSEALSRLGANAVVFDAPGLYEQVQVMVARQPLMEENPRIVHKALQAILDAELFTVSHPRESATIMARFLSTPAPSIEAIVPTSRGQVGLSQAFFVLMESEAHWAIEAGLAQQASIPNYLQLIDAAPLAQLKPQAVTLIR
jgi:sulfonate transport system substrate-binding protein